MKLLGELALGLVFIHSASAAVLYSTLGPNDSYSTMYGYALIGQGVSDMIQTPAYPSNPRAVATPFTVPGNAGEIYTLSTLEIVAGRSNAGVIGTGDGRCLYPPDASFGTLSINQNSASLPGSSIFSIQATQGVMKDGPDFYNIFTFSISTPVMLEAGATYWLSIMPEWYTYNSLAQNTQNQYGLAASINNGATWNIEYGLAPAFRVSGELAPVPEPSTCLAGAAMLGMMGLIQWRRAGKSPQSGN